MLGYFDFSALAAGGESLVNVRGSYFRYNSGSAGGADTRIIVRADGGLYAILKPGQAVRLPDGLRVGNWRIENYLKAANIAGTVSIGEGWIDDNTITGDVNVIDGGLSRALSGLAFIGTDVCSAAAAQYPHVQLWNPAESGKNVYVPAFSVSVAVAQVVNVGSLTTGITTTAADFGPKLFGAAAGVASVRSQSIGTIVITKKINGMFIAANGSYDFQLREPIVLGPGVGLVLVGGTVNTTITGNFEWFELPV